MLFLPNMANSRKNGAWPMFIDDIPASHRVDGWLRVKQAGAGPAADQRAARLGDSTLSAAELLERFRFS